MRYVKFVDTFMHRDGDSYYDIARRNVSCYEIDYRWVYIRCYVKNGIYNWCSANIFRRYMQ